jgi:hypothetical protein
MHYNRTDWDATLTHSLPGFLDGCFQKMIFHGCQNFLYARNFPDIVTLTRSPFGSASLSM